MLLNPRHRHHQKHHKRHHRRHHRNPGSALGHGVVGSLKDVTKHPGDTLAQGAVGVTAAALTLAIPNQFLPMTGVGITDKLMRGATRVAAGALVVAGTRSIMPRQAGAAMAGASIAAIGSFVLDLMNLTLVLGVGDQTQTLTSFAPSLPTFGAYSGGGISAMRPFGAYVGRGPRPFGAYTRAQLTAARFGAVGPMMLQGPARRSALGGGY